MDAMSLLGKKVTDQITGFAGTVTGVCFYLTGCNQALVIPKTSDPNKAPEGQWYDVQRLTPAEDPAIVLDNGDTPGCDRAPPRSN